MEKVFSGCPSDVLQLLCLTLDKYLHMLLKELLTYIIDKQ